MDVTREAKLLLEDGTFYVGRSIGAVGTTTGELCFNTGMTGYQEIYTDPSYFGQILINTNVHIGNYGTRNAENESGSIKIAGMICRDFNRKQYRIMSDQTLQEFFENEKLVGIEGVDTRALVRHIRQKGAMNAVISSENKSDEELRKIVKDAPSMHGLELASKVSTQEMYDYGAENDGFKVAALDFGIKRNILKCMANRNCQIRVFPATTDFETMQAWKPDGYFLSNGPGDPAAMAYAVKTVKQILDSNKPLFGICLGHQLLALAADMSTYKLHHGHRGINHPVKNIITGKCEITSQNHGFGVKNESFEGHEDDVEITHINLNDKTVEGLRLKNKNAFSVQYHPEASPGPHDSRYLFDQFVELMKNHINSEL
jgi:carbamoyl-phosphate synthase small subunit